MISHFIRKNSNRCLDLIFAGWGMDYNLFCNEAGENDLCICYDYTNLIFDFNILEEYEEIRLLAWSMGVWASSKIFQNKSLPFSIKKAINGTLFPIDAELGIPPEIFIGTLDKWSEKTLIKFQRRMCYNKELNIAFEKVLPQRSLESVYEELKTLRDLTKDSNTPKFTFNEAIIGSQDLIFPALNQRLAWSRYPNTKIKEYNIPHYPGDFLKHLDQ